MKKISIVLLVGVLILTFCCRGTEEEVEKETKAVVSEEFVKVEEGLELRYKTVGNGPQAVIIPGAMYLEFELEGLIDEGRTLIFYDPRGRGRSSKVSDPNQIGMDFELSDLEAVRIHHGKEKISLIGVSFWGITVILYAEKYPDYVERIVQVGPLSPTQEISARRSLNPVNAEKQAKLNEMKEQGINKTDPVSYNQVFWEVIYSRYFYNPAKISQIQGEYYKFPNESPENVNFLMKGILQSIGKWDFREQVKGLDLPVLTVQGEHDPLPMEGARTWVYSLPDARLLVIPNSGHFPFIENPELFFPSVDVFLKGEWPERAEVVGVPVQVR